MFVSYARARDSLDFSCAIFGPDGGLVANAPHIPVHLGAMQDAVRLQLQWWKDDLREGDVLVSNHPQLAGGSHLPDITVMTPVFSGGEIVFFVARWAVALSLVALWLYLSLRPALILPRRRRPPPAAVECMW